MIVAEYFGVRRQSEAATALWISTRTQTSYESKAVSRCACHRTPKLHSERWC